MTFKGKISKAWYVATGVLNGLTIGGSLYAGLTMIIGMSVILMALMDLYLIPVFFKNEVRIEKKQVIVQFGLLSRTIPVKEISTVSTLRDYSASYAADFDRVRIQPRGKNIIYISIENREEFVRELLRENRKIRYIL